MTASGMADAEVVCHTVDLSIVGEGGQQPTPAGSAADEYPCTLVPEATVEQLTGNVVDPGDAATVHHDENGVTWTSRDCAWLSFADGAVEVDVGVTAAAGFPSGSVGCPVLPGPASPIVGLGGPATWAWNDPGTTIKEGRLRVCAAAALVDVRVTGPVGESAQQAVATGMAARVLAGR